jgi:hypothetical protein
MRHKTLVGSTALLIAILLASILANESQAASTPSMLERFRAYKSSCTQPILSKKTGRPQPLFSCEFTKMDSSTGTYTRNFGNKVRDPLSRYMVWGQKGFVSGSRNFKQGISDLKHLLSGQEEMKVTGDELAEILADDLRRTSAKLKLSECQQVCLSVCATNNLIKYDFKRFGEQMQIPALLEGGEGGCRAMSELTLWETRHLGLNETFQVGGYLKDSEGEQAHAWLAVRFKDKDKTYWIDTTSRDCRFIEEP